MGAPKGNEYYLLREKDGRDKKLSPDELEEKANQYFIWALENPLKEPVIHQKTGQILDLPKIRAFSIKGLCNFSNITHQTFLKYEESKDYIEVTTRVRQIIENQQFEGATSGLFNPNIIARKLGLADKQETEHKGSVKVVTYKLPDNGRDSGEDNN